MDRLSDDQAQDVAFTEIVADLDAIGRQAEGVERDALPPHEQPPTPEQLASNTAGELLAALTMARMLIAPGMAWFADFEATWSDQTLQAISTSGAAVLDLHGISASGLFQRYGPYIALAGATLPPTLMTYRAVKERQLEAARPKREAPADGNAQPPAH